MTTYRGHIRVSEDFFRTLMPQLRAEPGFIRDVVWHAEKNSLKLTWQENVPQEVEWSEIAAKIPGTPPVPVYAWVDHESDSVGLLLKGEAEGAFLKPRKPDLGVVLIGVVTTTGYHPAG